MLYNIKAVRGWGGSGTLHLKSAISEPNAFLDEVYGRPRAVRNVDSKVLCNAMPRTVSGRERSSTKRMFACAIR